MVIPYLEVSVGIPYMEIDARTWEKGDVAKLFYPGTSIFLLSGFWFALFSALLLSRSRF